MTDSVRFGSLVLPRDPSGAAVPPAEARSVGIVAEVRRTDCRVLCPRSGRSYWIVRRALRPARLDEVEGALERTVADVLELLRAQALELDRGPEGRWRLSASHGTLTPRTVDQVRALIGPRLSAYAIRPQGMHRIQTVLEFSET